MFEEKKTALVSRNITVNKKRTSIRLEAQMWVALKEIAIREKCTVHDICTIIGAKKADNITLTAAIRIFLMLCFKSAATEEGHKKAGHGAFHRMLTRAANTVVPSYKDDQISATAH